MENLDEQFEIFWKAYPCKKSKIRARRKFDKATKTATLGEMLKGLRRYVVAKPTWQSWQYPDRWLNEQGWTEDWKEPETVDIARQLVPADEIRKQHIAAIIKNQSIKPPPEKTQASKIRVNELRKKLR